MAVPGVAAARDVAAQRAAGSVDLVEVPVALGLGDQGGGHDGGMGLVRVIVGGKSSEATPERTEQSEPVGDDCHRVWRPVDQGGGHLALEDVEAERTLAMTVVDVAIDDPSGSDLCADPVSVSFDDVDEGSPASWSQGLRVADVLVSQAG